MDGTTTSSERERAALLGLWAVPGIGPKTLERLRSSAGGTLQPLLSAPPRDWAVDLGLAPAVVRRLEPVPSLDSLSSRILERAHAGAMRVVYPGDVGFPENLASADGAPPLLFWRGTARAPRRRLAMVGSRHPDQGFLPRARALARELAEGGAGVVSGAAEGVDRACHWGALDVKGAETWAFLGSALDELDPAQAKLLPHFLEGGGSFYSELPPGVRASTRTFPRRNRLISGASDAVLVLRAGEGSGSLYTALAALQQGRTLLALPGDIHNPAAAGCNALLWTGKARLCRGVGDLWSALGLAPGAALAAARAEAGEGSKELSSEARLAYGALVRAPRSFEEVRASSQLAPGALVSALCELELLGLALQHPGKLYERI